MSISLNNYLASDAFTITLHQFISNLDRDIVLDRLDYKKIIEKIEKIYLKTIVSVLDNSQYKAIQKLLEDVSSVINDANNRYYLSQAVMHSKLRTIEEYIIKIINFDNFILLAEINYIIETYHLEVCGLHSLIFETYYELIDFKNSGMDENQYNREVQAIMKKAEELQKFSSNKITLDKIPKHPSDTFQWFIFSISRLKNGNKDVTLVLINTISKSVLNTEYSRLPRKTNGYINSITLRDKYNSYHDEYQRHKNPNDKFTISDTMINEIKEFIRTNGQLTYDFTDETNRVETVYDCSPPVYIK